MDISAESAQLISAEQLRKAARDLAHSTQTVQHPSDSYELLGRLMNAQRLLGQVFEQLASWHARTGDGIHYDGEDGRGAGQAAGVIRAELALRDAADLANRADDALTLALSANGVIRWYDDPHGAS